MCKVPGKVQQRFIKKLDMSLSPLGFGVMRLPTDAEGLAEAGKLLASALECGVNYFDTAFPYMGGCSEELIREAIVRQFPRESFVIADKLPVWECETALDMERIFQAQLERLGVETIDLYLLHSLHRERWLEIQSKGVLRFLDAKRKEGRIRRAGFSLHDTPDTLADILDAYDWDFAQLQINYFDWTAQQARDSYECLAKRDVPCMVMEPVGGGRLSKLPGGAAALLRDMNPGASAASWAIRFVAGLSNVAVTLSGMSDMDQLRDNLSCFDPIVPLSAVEHGALDRVVRILSEADTVPCTACRYCVDECPGGIDIPNIFRRYNDYRMFENVARLDIDYFTFVPPGHRGDACIACGRCSKKCPQRIDIPKELRTVHETAISLALGVNVGKLQARLRGEAGAMLVCFGAGRMGRTAQELLVGCGCSVDYYCDNAQSLWGGQVNNVPVISPDGLLALSRTVGVVVLITNAHAGEIRAQLEKMGLASSIA